MADRLSDADLAAIRQGLERGHRCSVCDGVSPPWDGHDRNPPCVGWAHAQIPALIDEVETLRAKVARLKAKIARLKSSAAEPLIEMLDGESSE